MSERQTPRGKKSAESETAETPASFEESARRLAKIVEQLEAGELSLEDSLGLFEEGVALARTAEERLVRAERRIEELLSVDANGRPVTKAFEAG